MTVGLFALKVLMDVVILSKEYVKDVTAAAVVIAEAAGGDVNVIQDY